MHRVFYLLLVIFLPGCCFINYTGDVKEIGNQVKSEMLSFYQEQHHYPHEKDEQLILAAMGCEQVSLSPPIYNCEGVKYEISGSFVSPPDEWATLDVRRSSTLCQYRFHEGGNGQESIDEIKCWQLPCLDLRQ